MKIKILLIISAICMLCSCEKYPESFTITDARVQRITLEDSALIGKRLYMLNLEVKYNYAYYLMFTRSPTLYTEKGLDRTIENIDIYDYTEHSIINQCSILNHYKDAEFDQLPFGLSKKNLTNRIYSYKNWEDVKATFQRGGERTWSSNDRLIFYIDDSEPQPESFVIKFSDHELKVKVNNTPVHYVSER